MKTRKIIVAVVFILAILALGGWVWQSQTASASTDTSLEATGTIETTEVSIAPELGGRVTEVLVAEGKPVAKGQILVQLDGAVLEAQRSQAEAAVAAAQAQLKAARANDDLLKAGAQREQIDAAEQAVQTVKANVAGASAQLAQLQDGPRAADIAAAEAAAAQAAAQLKVSQDTYDKVTQCVTIKMPDGTKNEVCPGLGTREEQARAALKAAQEAAAAAQQRVEQLKNGATRNELNAARAQVTAAQSQQAMAQAQLELLQNGARPEQEAAAQAQVEVAQAQADAAAAALKVFDAQIDQLTLRAPSAGVVLNRAIEPGEVVMPGATLLSIGRLDSLKVTVYLPEDRFGRVTPGQPVSLRVDAYPERVFSGTVRRVADQAEFTPTNIQTKDDRTRLVYAVVIGIDNPDLALKPGMIADVTFGS